MTTDWDKEFEKAADNIGTTKAVIRKDGSKSKPYCIYSESGKNLGCYATRKGAEDRLKQIEMFKHMDKKD